MRILLWLGDEANQRALACKFAAQHEVVGIVLERRNEQPNRTIKGIFEALIDRVFFKKIRNAWFGMKDYYDLRYPEYPKVKQLVVENINSEEAFLFTKELNPDLVAVSGTRLVKKHMFQLKPGRGIINLHTGLSPYIKGGPNCTNWCIASKQYGYIGNTVMWIDEGIDSGNLIATELTDLKGARTLDDIHIRVMEHAHELYISGVKAIQQQIAPNVVQSSIANGKVYYSKEWGLLQKWQLIRNLSEYINYVSEEHRSADTIELIALPFDEPTL